MIRALIASLGAASIIGCGQPAATPEAQADKGDPLQVSANTDLLARLSVADVRHAEVRETLRIPGRVEVDEQRVTRVGAPVTGRVTEIDATVGQVVKRGEVLATLYSTELTGAQLGFLKAYSQKLLAERAASRAKQLLDAEIIGRAELERRQAELVQANAEVSAARGQLKVLGMSEAAAMKLATSGTVDSLSHTVSNIDGTIIERKVTQGQVVQPADTMFIVADLSQLWLVADVPEQSVGAVRVGEGVTAEIPALPGLEIDGTLSFVGVAVNPETRTVRVRMDLPNPERIYKPAMLASLLLKGKPQRRQVVPAASVVREENKDYVFVQTGSDAFRLREVAVGPETDGLRPLIRGVREGEKIVVDGAFHLNNERKRRLLQGS
jgi:cobalt-zinc-cadmium efflux system membrane fusion protein